jgi:hypothetical protein
LVDGSTADVVGSDNNSGGDLLLMSTTHATKGDIQFHSTSYIIDSNGAATFGTAETINGIDISAGAVSDVADLALLLGASNDFTIDAFDGFGADRRREAVDEPVH